jgi:hypothetical protein
MTQHWNRFVLGITALVLGVIYACAVAGGWFVLVAMVITVVGGDPLWGMTPIADAVYRVQAWGGVVLAVLTIAYVIGRGMPEPGE